MLPFTRETPDRLWLGFVDEADSKTASVLSTRVLPVLVVAGIAALVLSGGKRRAEPEAPPASSAAAARMQVAAAGHDVAPKDASETAMSVASTRAEPEAGLDAVPNAAAEPTPEPQASVEDPPVVAAPDTDPKPRPKIVREPKPLSAGAARRASRAARALRGALGDGRVAASPENFARVTASGDELGWEEAKSTCANLEVDGVAGWSLPSRGQAREIHRGKAAPRSAYWTRQRGPHGDTIYVYDPRTRRASPWLDQEIASVVCVQPRPR